jgi:2-hydroxychromene-2-carboxylate isomerase
MTEHATNDTVDFWFDPGCPFTWATSTWAREAATASDAVIRWHVMSLAVLNEGKPVPEQVKDALARSWRPVRLLAAASAEHGNHAVGQLYAAIGRRVHDEKRQVDDQLLTEALQEAGLPQQLLAAADDPAMDAAVRDSHRQGQDLVGTGSGSPITSFGGGPAFFGPVVSPAPTGAAALDLWDAMVAASRVPGLSEIKRSRQPL